MTTETPVFDPAVRPSAQSRRVSTAMRSTLRPLTRAATTGTVQVGAARALFDTLMARLCRPDAGTQWTPVRTEHDGHPVVGEWVRAPGVELRTDAAVLYMHGSGFVFCSLRSHRGLVSRISAVTGLPVLSLDYRLAPEHPYPAAPADVLAAYRHLLDEGYAPERIIVAGDSAGGHLSLGLAAELRRQGLPLPAGLVLISPWLDPSWELAKLRDRTCRDPFFDPEAGRRCVNLYVGATDPRDPGIDLLNTAPAGLPPILLQAGGSECFSAEAEELARRITAAGGSCELQVWPGQVHVFQALFRLLPEADAALAHVGRFVQDVAA